MNFTIISASETSSMLREFCYMNFPGRFQHFYDSIESQLAGNGHCSMCSQNVLANLCGPCRPKAELARNTSVQLMVTGSPCDPFSTQRCKRFSAGNVKEHSAFDITMEKVVKLYAEHEPEKGILEQVWGFTLPFSPEDSETPKDRLVFDQNFDKIVYTSDFTLKL